MTAKVLHVTWLIISWLALLSFIGNAVRYGGAWIAGWTPPSPDAGLIACLGASAFVAWTLFDQRYSKEA